MSDTESPFGPTWVFTDKFKKKILDALQNPSAFDQSFNLVVSAPQQIRVFVNDVAGNRVAELKGMPIPWTSDDWYTIYFPIKWVPEVSTDGDIGIDFNMELSSNNQGDRE